MIKAGMSIAEAILQLTKGFKKVMGRAPDGLEKIKIQQEAVQRLKNLEKVVDMQGNVIDTSKGIMGGRQIQDNKEFGDALKKALMEKDNPYSDLVKTTQKGPKTLEQRRKEAEEALKNKNVTPIKDPEDMAQGGRAGFSAGTGIKGIKTLLNLFKSKPKPKFDVERFREGPIDLDFLENVDKKDIEKFIRTRDAKGPGSYGMYDNFADMPAGLKSAELIKRFVDRKTGRINYENAETFIGKKLKGDESVDELLQILNRQEMRAEGGRIGLKDGPELSDFVNVQASGSKSGKQQIKGAPEGITMDSESINAIVKADIPIAQKIDLLAKYQYGKGRTRIEQDDNEIFLDEGGFKSRDIGFGFNKSALIEGSDGEGIGGTLLYNMETGEPQLNIGFKKKFADGGRIGLKDGPDKPGRRKFIKTAVGIASMIPFIGKGVKYAAPVIKKGAELTGPALDKIIETVMSAGKVISQSGKRLKELTTKKKLGKIEVEEDMMDQSYIIKKDGKEIYYKKGRMDETGGIDDDIIEVIEDTVTKKASGGVARLLGE